MHRRVKQLGVGTLLVASSLIGMAGVAKADQPAKTIEFGKGDASCANILSSGAGHWAPDFNPSDVNHFVHANDCPNSVLVSGQVLKP
jgi:hypothetical protein